MGVMLPNRRYRACRPPKEDLPMKLLARVFAAAVTCATVALPLVAADAPSASAAPTWAPAATAPIHPGVQTVTAGWTRRRHPSSLPPPYTPCIRPARPAHRPRGGPAPGRPTGWPLR